MNPNIQLVAHGIMQAAQAETHLEVLLLLAEHIGMREVDGLPVEQWILAKQSQRIDRHVLKLGDTHPEIAEAVAALIRAGAAKTKPS